MILLLFVPSVNVDGIIPTTSELNDIPLRAVDPPKDLRSVHERAVYRAEAMKGLFYVEIATRLGSPFGTLQSGFSHSAGREVSSGNDAGFLISPAERRHRMQSNMLRLDTAYRRLRMRPATCLQLCACVRMPASAFVRQFAGPISRQPIPFRRSTDTGRHGRRRQWRHPSQ